jgi:putative ABC transport system permease protein
MVDLSYFFSILKVGIKNLKDEQLRTWLTMFGIIIGVFSVYALVILGNGLTLAINQKIKGLGSNIIQISSSQGPTFEILRFTEQDIKKIKRVSGVREVIPNYFKSSIVEYKGGKKILSVIASPPDLAKELREESGIEIVEGRELKESDRYSAIIGHKLAKEGFDNKIRLNSNLIIDDKQYKVKGILKEGQNENMIFVSDNPFIYENNMSNKISAMAVIIDRSFDIELVADEISNLLSKSYNEKLFVVLTPERILKLINTIVGGVTGSVTLIALISLVVGAIGIANSMFTSVMKKTRDIGIMKAVGATNEDIKTIFICESSIIGFFGGVLGIIFSVILLYIGKLVIEYTEFEYLIIQFNIPWAIYLILGATIVGAIAGVLPAIKASKLNPTEALRYE